MSWSLVSSAPHHPKGTVEAGLCYEQETRLQQLFPQAFQASSCFPAHTGVCQASTFRGCCRLRVPAPAWLCSALGQVSPMSSQ